MTTVPIDDPVLRSARREMIVTFLIAAIAMSWSVGYSYANGYLGDPHTMELVGVEEAKSNTSSSPVIEVRDKKTGEVVRKVRFILGFPDWIVWGVIVPWGLCVGISFAFGSIFMQDDELGEDQVEEGGRDA